MIALRVMVSSLRTNDLEYGHAFKFVVPNNSVSNPLGGVWAKYHILGSRHR